MKKGIIAVLMCAGLVSLGFLAAQGNRSDLFDLKKSRQELEIMKGVLSTTMDFAAQELRTKSGGEESSRARAYGRAFGSSGISAYYLYGQGATFLVPVSGRRVFPIKEGVQYAAVRAYVDQEQLQKEIQQSLEVSLHAHNLELEKMDEAMAEASEEMARASAELARETRRESRQTGSSSSSASSSASATANAGQASQPGQKPKIAAEDEKARKERIQKKVAEAQERIRKSKEEAAALQKKFEEALPALKSQLIEALANHGDSLTQIKPNEYINLMLRMDREFGLHFDTDDERARTDVISVQKSLITDYKAGRLSLDAFKQKVLQYTN